MPWWLDNKKLDFPRGYHIEVWGGAKPPRPALEAASRGCRGLRQAAQERLPRYYGAYIAPGRGEIPNEGSYARSTPTWSISGDPGAEVPLEVHRLRVQVKHAGDVPSAHQRWWHAMERHTQQEDGYGIAAGGVIHELGSAHGRRSQARQERQPPDARGEECVRADGGPPTCKPTRTHVDDQALSWRTSEYSDQLKKRAL